MSVNYSAKLILGYRIPSYLIGTVITKEKIRDLEEEGYWHYTNAIAPKSLMQLWALFWIPAMMAQV